MSEKKPTLWNVLLPGLVGAIVALVCIAAWELSNGRSVHAGEPKIAEVFRDVFFTIPYHCRWYTLGVTYLALCWLVIGPAASRARWQYNKLQTEARWNNASISYMTDRRLDSCWVWLWSPLWCLTWYPCLWSWQVWVRLVYGK